MALSLVLLTSLSYCNGRDRGEAKEWALETVARGEASGITQERREAIRDEATWEAFWKVHAGSDAPPPDLDFQKEIVIVVHLGTRGSSGYAVSVTRVEDQVERSAVYYDESKPGPRCIVAQVLTQPHHIVKVRRTDNALFFIENEEIRDC
jgi:hypothetical protein